MRRYLKRTLYTVLVLFVVLVSLLAFILTTTPGFYVALKLVNLAIPGKVWVKKPHGRLLDNLSFETLSYQDELTHIKIQQGHLTWKPTALLQRQLLIEAIHANKILVHTTPEKVTATEQKPAPTTSAFPQLPVDVVIHNLSVSKLELKQFDQSQVIEGIKLTADLNQSTWEVKTFKLKYQDFSLYFKGKSSPVYPYKIQAKAKFSSAGNSNHGELSLTGDMEKYLIRGKASGKVNAHINGYLKHFEMLNIDLSWRKSQIPLNADQIIESVSGNLNLHGPLSNLAISSLVELNQPVEASLRLKGTVTPEDIKAHSTLNLLEGTLAAQLFIDRKTNKIEGEIKARHLNLVDYGLPVSQLSFESTLNKGTADDLRASFNLSGQYDGHLMKAYGAYQPDAFSASLNIAGNEANLTGQSMTRWRASLNFPFLNRFHPVLKGLQANLNAKAEMTTEHQGELSLKLSPGRYHSLDDQALPELTFEGGYFNAQITPEGLIGKGHITIDRNKSMSLTLALPKFNLKEFDYQTQTLNGQARLMFDTLDFLDALSPQIQKARGRLSLDLSTKGTLASPTVSGDLSLNSASVHLPQLGLTLEPITFKLTTQNSQWQAKGSIVSQGRPLNFSGQGALSPELRGKVSISGQSWPVIDTPEYFVSLSPSLDLSFSPGELDVKGKVIIPKAKLKPVTFSDTVSLTDDAVFVNDKKDDNPLNLTADVGIEMEDEVKLDVKGLHGFLTGAIQFRQLPQGAPFAVGELRVRDGKYQAYGQDLVIQEAQLIFTGGLISNPGIRVRAVRTFKNASSSFSASNRWFDFSSGNLDTINLGNRVIVGIEVTGRVNTPKIKLFSSPANLSQADILSMIILGRPASQANRSGGQLLLTAISAMDLDSGTKGTQLLNQLKGSLGFDFDFQNTSSYNQATNETSEKSAFVLGKSLSKRLYLSYNIGLSQEDSNILTLNYILNKYFSIQVSASDSGSGLDFLYNHTKE